MSHAERVGLLGGMRAAAPPDVFEMFRNAARASLPEDEYLAVAAPPASPEPDSPHCR